jgi:hypothetical protein
MLQLRVERRWLWLLLALIVLPILWVLQIELTYERNLRHGIPADFREYEPHEVVMWRV